MNELEQKLKNFFLEHSYSERDGYYKTTYSFDEDYTCTMDVQVFNEEYDDAPDDKELDEEARLLDCQLEIINKDRLKVVSIISYFTSNQEWGGLEIQEVEGKDQLVKWMDSEPAIVRWAGTD